MATGMDQVRKLTSDQRALVVAAQLIADRVSQMSEGDQEDMFGFLRDLWSATTEEEREAADEAIWELVARESMTVHEMDMEAGGGTLKKWKTLIGERVKELRKERSWTQEKLAEASGLPQSHISRIERGDLSPSHLTLEKIASALGLHVKDIDTTYCEDD